MVKAKIPNIMSQLNRWHKPFLFCIVVLADTTDDNNVHLWCDRTHTHKKMILVYANCIWVTLSFTIEIVGLIIRFKCGHPHSQYYPNRVHSNLHNRRKPMWGEGPHSSSSSFSWSSSSSIHTQLPIQWMNDSRSMCERNQMSRVIETQSIAKKI